MFEYNYGRTHKELTNNGNVSGTSQVGGIIGSVINVTSQQGTWYKDTKRNGYTYYHYYYTETVFKGFCNTGDITATDNNCGGIIGYAYFESTYYGIWNCHSSYSGNKYKCEFYGDFKLTSTGFTNSGEVSGTSNVGEMFGYFDADLASTLTTYTIVGHVTVNGQTLEGDYAAGTKYDMTISDRVIPEVEAPEEEIPEGDTVVDEVVG